MTVKFYGNGNETFAVTKKGIYLIQSVDTDLIEQFDELPESVEKLEPITCQDLELPEWIL